MADKLVDASGAVPPLNAAVNAEAPHHTDAPPDYRADDRTYVSAPAFLRGLSPEARAAVARADEFRTRWGRGGIDLEHLLVGLYGETGGPTRRTFDAAGVDASELARRLHDAGLDAPRLFGVTDGDPTREEFRGTSLQPVPQLTQDALDILLVGERRSSSGPMTAGITGTEQLLRAFAERTYLPASRAFADVWPHIEAATRPVPNAPTSDTTPGTTPLVVRELTAAELDALVGSLSVSSRKALGVAEALRTERGADAVRMEHLLVGLTVQHGGHQAQILDAAGLDAAALVTRLAPFELALGRVSSSSNASVRPELTAPTAEPVDRMPSLSKHATLALTAAAWVAGWAPLLPPGRDFVQARHLLAGWFAVRECHVVAALAAERPAVREGITARILSDGEADLITSAVEDEQIRRLAALLDDPPTIAWERLTPPETSPATPTRPRQPTGTGAGARNDQPAGEDRLRFCDYVTAFANLIDSPRTTPPLTIGIYGAWGSGKSFLLKKLVEEMKARRASPPPERRQVYCVSFNAWEYNASPQIWPRLVRRVVDCVEDTLTEHARRELRRRRFWPNLRRRIASEWQQIVAWWIVFAFLAFVLTVATSRLGEALFSFAVVPLDDKFTLAAVLGGLGTLAKSVREAFVAPLGEWITAALDDGPSYGVESVAMAVVRKDLDRLDARLTNEESRVLIVIDDLDRCEPEKAVEMLQAINLLLDQKSFIICLGIDARVITAAVEKHYAELLGPAGITGYEYLDKIIQIPFRIPDPNDGDLKRFLSMQLGDPKAEEEAPRVDVAAALRGNDGAPRTPLAQLATPQEIAKLGLPNTQSVPDAPDSNVTPDATRGSTAGVAGSAPPAIDRRPARVDAPTAPSFRHAELLAFEQIAPFLRPNPRHVKRLVNVYALVRSLAELGKNETILADPEATVRWLTLCAQWPYATRRMLDHLDAHGVPADAPADAVPLRALLGAVAASLDPVKRSRYDHDTLLLDQIVASSEGLSWDELRALRTYTVNFNPALDSELRVLATENLEPTASADGRADVKQTSKRTRKRSV